MAELTGVSPSRIRYYEKVGVLPAPDRTPGGYRAYDGEAVARLEFLQRGKLLGLTLPEIAKVLRASQQGCCDAADPLLGQFLRDKLAQFDDHIAQLQGLRSALEQALTRLAEDAVAETAQSGVACGSAACATPVVGPRRR
ncbi:MAG: MerR family transcriptional regulator [Haloechinothrix sp.]